MKSNYLNNKDILKEIHKSKISYCSFKRPEYADYDLIIDNIKKINKKNIVLARKARAERLSKQAHEAAVAAAGQKLKFEDYEIKWTKIPAADVVFRLMTWDHIPLDDVKTKRARAVAKELHDEDDSLHTEYDEDDPKHNKYVKVNFPPFQHLKIDDTNEPVVVGKSHWIGGMKTGKFNKDHGSMTPKLAHMFIKLCERYATRSNWRGYCVDIDTQALTQRGWLNMNEINESDIILSYQNQKLTWSKIKSIYRGQYSGLMHYISSRSIDSLITPNHKLVTARGLVPVELIKQSDQIIVMGQAVEAPINKKYEDSFVELVGWIMTEGCYEYGGDKKIKRISIYQNIGPKANRIRKCLTALQYEFSESNSKNISFSLRKKHCTEFVKTFPNKNLNMPFLLSLTQSQRELLINTMIDGDGWRRGEHISYCQKNEEHVKMFQALLTMVGKKSNAHHVKNHMSYGKPVDFYNINVFSKRGNTTRGECLNFHGGARTGVGINRAKGKAAYPNEPTVQYDNWVWCPETEYGCFVARRNGKVFLTGNTYNDEMRSQALLQLSQIGLQFDENKSQNPFAYYTAAITNSFTRVLNIEKRNQNLRDDILELNNLNPSYTRQNMNISTSARED